MKVTLSEIKKNLREPTMEAMKLRSKSMIWNIRKKKSFNQNSKKKKEFFKNEDRIRSFWGSSKYTNIQITGMPEGKEEEQETEKLFEKIMKANSLIRERK